MKIFFLLKRRIGSIFYLYLCILIFSVAISQLIMAHSKSMAKEAWTNSQSVLNSVTLWVEQEYDKDIKILKNGAFAADFKSGNTTLNVETDDIIHVFNPSDKVINVSIASSHVSTDLLPGVQKIPCKSGITYICRAK